MEELHGGGGFGARVEWGQSMELLKEERNRRSWLCHSSWLLRSSSSSLAVTCCNITTVDILRKEQDEDFYQHWLSFLHVDTAYRTRPLHLGD